MIKKMIAVVLAFSMLFGMTISVFAENSNENGSASGTTTLSGEIEYTTAYTLTIPASINNMNLSQDAQTTVGEVKVTKQNNNAEFDPAKKVSVTVNYTGDLVNDKNSDKKVLYKLQQKKGELESTDITTDSKLDFSASEIEAGNVAYNLNAIVTETNKAGGTYSGTINFSAQVEAAKIRFTITCSGDYNDNVETYTYEVEPGTTLKEFARNNSNDYNYDSEYNKIGCKRGECIVYIYGTNTWANADEEIVDGAAFRC